MSEKQLLIVIHGMGKHTPESFKKEIVCAANNALHRYASYTSKKFEEQVYIESIGYDDIFEKMRKEYADSGKTLKKFVSDGLGGSNLPPFIDKLADVESEFGNDEFIYTHILDVIFYLTLLGEKVRLQVARQFVEAIKKYSSGIRINLVAHSLGTAVMHDTLNKLYTTGYKRATGEMERTANNDEIYLDPFTLPVDMYWTLANVSPIITTLSGLTGPMDSIVKPGAEGCVGSFLNVFHEFDPFTLKFINRFDPQESDNWVDPMTYQLSYKRYKTTKVARKNTHSTGDCTEAGGYLEDPLVCHDFLSSLMEFQPGDAEKKAGDDSYKNIQDEARKIKDFVDSLESLKDQPNLMKLFKMLKAFRDYLDGLPF